MAQEIIHQLKVTGPGIDQTFEIPPGITAVGRQDTNHLVLVHPLVSRRHAEIVCADNACTITDLGSMHGTMVNRERLEPNTPTPLNSGDVIEIGAFRMVYEGAADTEPEIIIEDESASEEVDESVVEEEETAVSPPETPPQPVESPPTQTPPPVRVRDTTTYTPGIIAPLPKPATNGHTKFSLPAGLSLTNSSYLNFLPDIYRTGYNNFIARFLALLESILAPIEWNVDNFDLFLDPATAPAGFLPWLANWFNLSFDHTWNEEKQRRLLEEAHLIYRRRGTAWALQRILEIYTGKIIEIDDQNHNLDALTFVVKIAASERELSRSAIEQIINANKPAHTNYSLLFIS